MKQRLTLLLLLSSAFATVGQTTFPLFTTSESIDIGNIKAGYLVHGDMWWDPVTAMPRCEYPKGSGKNVSSATGLWVGGYDAMGSLHVAAQTYRQKGNDYWPGPIDTGALKQVSYVTTQAWAKIWKINQTQIDSFRASAIHTAANTPTSILEWPAKGNPYARGAGGVAIVVNQPMAPFVDVNTDGLYNPLSGDYPAIKGEQMLWWVFNDNGPTVHTVSQTTALGVDVKVMAYAYQGNPILANVIFYEYQLRNHSGSSYAAFRFGLGADMELGDSSDDYVGFDSSHRMGFVYNSKNVDAVYGARPPIAAIAITEAPGDTYQAYRPAGSFMTYLNSGGINGDPTNGLEIYRLLDARNRAGTPLLNNGRYQYVQDTMCNLPLTATDFRYAISSDSFTLLAGGSAKIGMALIIAPGGGCPSHSLDTIKISADTAFKYYWNPRRPQTTGITGIGKTNVLRIYPNPASSILNIESPGNSPFTVQVYDAFGRAHTLPINQHGSKTELLINSLPAGIYTVRYQSSVGNGAMVFVKE